MFVLLISLLISLVEVSEATIVKIYHNQREGEGNSFFVNSKYTECVL
jgi:hypothetical protein